ncbi:hypothetical protein [Shewanella algae]|uniref:hypothetical protein n=1 Tax=Shewanella algae TaxID=38313 RepID=UPI0031F502D5
MALPVTLFMSTDAGAPQIVNGDLNDLIAILKACLVDGYGTKDALGWSVAFEDAPNSKIAFRNSTVDGSGGYVQLWPETGVGSNQDISLTAAASMTALDLFTNQGFEYKYRMNLSENVWMLVGTSTGFYFQTQNSSYVATQNRLSLYTQCFFAGDFHSYHSPDPGAFIVSCGNVTDAVANASNTYSVGRLNRDYSVGKIYDLDGSANNYIHITPFLIYESSQSQSPGTLGDITMPIVFRDAEITAGYQPSLADSNGVYVGNSTTRPIIRGKFPGLLQCSTAAYYNQPWPALYSINNVEYIGIVGGSGVQLWVSTEAWYD